MFLRFLRHIIHLFVVFFQVYRMEVRTRTTNSATFGRFPQNSNAYQCFSSRPTQIRCQQNARARFPTRLTRYVATYCQLHIFGKRLHALTQLSAYYCARLLAPRNQQTTVKQLYFSVGLGRFSSPFSCRCPEKCHLIGKTQYEFPERPATPQRKLNST